MSEPADGPARRNVQVSDYVRERLGELAEAYQREERLPRRPTFDDVIRRLLLARDQLAGQHGGMELTDEQYEAAKRELFRRWPSEEAARQAAADLLAGIREREAGGQP